MMNDTLLDLKTLLTEESLFERLGGAIENYRSKCCAEAVQAGDAFEMALSDYRHLPKYLEEYFAKLLSTTPPLAPCTAKDLAIAATRVYAGADLHLPEQRRAAADRLAAAVANELSPAWGREWVDSPQIDKLSIDAFLGNDATTIVNHHYPYDKDDRGGVDPITNYLVQKDDTAFCDLDLMMPEALAEFYSYRGEDCDIQIGSEFTRWPESESHDPNIESRIQSFMSARPWEKPLWSGSWNTGVYLLLGLRQDKVGDFYLVFKAMLDGFFTKEALSIAEQTLVPFVEPVLITVLDAATQSERIPTESELYHEFADRLFESHGRDDISQKDLAKDPIVRMKAKPSCLYIYSDEIQAMVSRCLDTCLARQEDRNGIDEQVFIALMLVAEARKAPHDGVAVALAFAAIESLLTDKKDSLRDVLKHYCVVLLQPDPKLRTDKQRSRVAKLYDRRCEVMHGHGLDGSPEERTAAMRLAAGVLRAVCAICENYRLMGKTLNKTELRVELNSSSELGRSFVGTTDLSDLLPPNFK